CCQSPGESDVGDVECNSRLDPTKTTLLKVSAILNHPSLQKDMFVFFAESAPLMCLPSMCLSCVLPLDGDRLRRKEFHGLRLHSSAASRMLSFFSSKPPEDISPGLALALEVKC
uniref:Uncharacterized protein n=1 Tax=Phasianus colchicus TaxID=9054 RepID=A0A669R394_PHACC